MEGLPKKVMVFDYQPGKTLVLGVAELANEVGALAEATGILAKLGINLSMVSATDVPSRKTAIMGFVGAVHSEGDIRRIEEALRASPRVKSCKTVRSDRGLISDVLRFPVWIADGQPALLMTPSSLNSMFSRMKKLFGTGGEAMLYEQGLAVGKQAAGIFAKSVPIEQLRELGPYVCGIYSALGWGLMKIKKRERGDSRLTIAIRDNFETKGVTSSGPNCHFVRGALAGYCSVVFGRNYSCRETKCAAAGKPLCEFVLT